MKDPGLELEGAYRNTQGQSHIDWWYGGGESAWSTLALALQNIPISKRNGQTIGVLINSKIVEYWWPDPTKLNDADVIIKTTDLTNVYDKEEIDLKLNNLPLPNKGSLGIDNVDNTSDLNKPVSEPTKTLITQEVQTLTTKILEVESSILQPFSESLIFTYLGTSVKLSLAFVPKAPCVAFLSSYPLNAFYDYYFENNYVIIRADELTLNTTYTLNITYLK